ncbi:MAG: NAD(P)/FAD-dependent oxidoreductase [Phycisphaerae bacterium]|nr:NAD(P)/FAD-dependent oxidoreductase [Phycisphaerae bacterium]
MTADRADVVIVGAGAAGLMTAIRAGRLAPGASIVLLDSARTLGAKILVAGGGRCNVTHDVVDDRAYAGSTRPAIRNVLRRFDIEATVAFFKELGVELKREATGKLFPTTDSARTVLDALLSAVRDAGAVVHHPCRVDTVGCDGADFVVEGPWGALRAGMLVLATGGKALPKSGSDGAGYRFAQTFGHSVTERIVPALVPLLLPDRHPLRELAGITVDADIRLVSGTGKTLVTFSGSMLCAHFGLSGPVILDISRYWSEVRARDEQAELRIGFVAGATVESLDSELLQGGHATPLAWLRGRMPERLARTLFAIASVDPGASLRQLSKEQRQRLAATVAALPVQPTGDRGFTVAEVTAGGVPLAEVHLDTMESRCTRGLYLVGELCDVDGRIGGFNFQWAWASGWVAGAAIAKRRT